jgi:hypothetical protein
MSRLPSRCSFTAPAVGYRQAGAGAAVLLQHGSASSSIMWQPIMALLQPLYRATAMNAFIRFWCGEGTWERFSGATRSAMIAAVDKVARDWRASFLFDPGPERLNVLAGAPRS